MASSSMDTPLPADSFVRPKDSFDHEFEKEVTIGGRLIAEHGQEKQWELERDLAQHRLDDNFLDEKSGHSATLQAHGSSSRRTQNEQAPTALTVLCAYVVEHQIGISVNLLLLLAMTHALFPRLRPFTQKFFTLSYYDASTDLYTRGADDMYFVALWVVIITGLRCFIMDYVFQPLARLAGLKRKRVRSRFAEQGWLIVYAGTVWTLGMYILRQQPYWFNLPELWTNFPTATMEGLFKFYYLVQFAFWLQQILVVNIEERRNDYAQMFTHHIFTSALMFFSYGYYQVKVGIVFLCLMDAADILLPLAKCLKYLEFQTSCDIAFASFMLTWLATRHIGYLMVCWSLWFDVPKHMAFGCFDSPSGKMLTDDYNAYSFGDGILTNVMRGWQDPNGVVCYNPKIQKVFLALLLSLQVITLLWFGMILRVAYKVVTGSGADEVRSEDEGPATEDDEVPPLKPAVPFTKGGTPPLSRRLSGSSTGSLSPYLEEEVSADKLYLPRRTSSPRLGRRTSRGGRTSAIHIPGHSDPKDILNRIGCETKTTDQD